MHYLMITLHLWLAASQLACQRDRSNKSHAPTPSPPTSEYCAPFAEALAILTQGPGDRNDLWSRMLEHKDRLTSASSTSARPMLDCLQQNQN